MKSLLYRLAMNAPGGIGQAVLLQRVAKRWQKKGVIRIPNLPNLNERNQNVSTSEYSGTSSNPEQNIDEQDAEHAAGKYEQSQDESDTDGIFRGSDDGSGTSEDVHVGELITPRECGVIGASVFGLVPSVWLKSDSLLWTDTEATEWGKAAHPVIAEWLDRLGRENAQLAILILVTGLIEQRKIAAFKQERERKQSAQRKQEPEQNRPAAAYGPESGASEL
jgi:hypothetical protein